MVRTTPGHDLLKMGQNEIDFDFYQHLSFLVTSPNLTRFINRTGPGLG